MIIAVDFDGTLVEHRYPDIGKTIVKTLSLVRQAQSAGHKIILYTCRGGEDLLEAITWCKDRGIELAAVNEDVPEVKDSEFGKSKSSKPFADIYLDDRALNVEDIEKLRSKLK